MARFRLDGTLELKDGRQVYGDDPVLVNDLPVSGYSAVIMA